jgi:hypothetical protein
MRDGASKVCGIHNSERIFCRMTDEWNEKLRCPICEKTGMASLSQGKHDDMPTVQSVPHGFKVVTTEYGPDFHCETCNVVVDP